MSDALTKAHEALRAKREAGEAVERIDPIEKARRNPKSLRRAVTAMCVRCFGGGEGAPVPRRDIRDCTAPACPLYLLRPYRERVAG